MSGELLANRVKILEDEVSEQKKKNQILTQDMKQIRNELNIEKELTSELKKSIDILKTEMKILRENLAKPNHSSMGTNDEQSSWDFGNFGEIMENQQAPNQENSDYGEDWGSSGSSDSWNSNNQHSSNFEGGSNGFGLNEDKKVTCFEACFKDLKEFKKVIYCLEPYIVNGVFEVSPNGISLEQMDPSHVSLVSLRLRLVFFESFSCTGGRMRIGMNFPVLANLLRETDDNVKLIMSHTLGDECIHFSVGVDIPLIEMETDDLAIPESEYDIVIKMGSLTFNKITRELMKFGDCCQIETSSKDKSVTFKCKEPDNRPPPKKGGKVFKLSSGEERDDSKIKIKINTIKNRMFFALRYLFNFSPDDLLSKDVTLSMSREAPLMVNYRLSGGYIRFYLAPKIGDDDDFQ